MYYLGLGEGISVDSDKLGEREGNGEGDTKTEVELIMVAVELLMVLLECGEVEERPVTTGEREIRETRAKDTSTTGTLLSNI